jgi:hypothetical protein
LARERPGARAPHRAGERPVVVGHPVAGRLSRARAAGVGAGAAVARGRHDARRREAVVREQLLGIDRRTLYRILDRQAAEDEG